MHRLDFSAPAWNSDLTAAALPSRALFITQDKCSTTKRMRQGPSGAKPLLASCYSILSEWLSSSLMQDSCSTFWCQVWIPRKRMSRGERRTCILNLKPVLAFMEGFYNMPPLISHWPNLYLTPFQRSPGSHLLKIRYTWYNLYITKVKQFVCTDLWLFTDAYACVITTPIKMEKFPSCWSSINWLLGHFEQNWGLVLKGRRRQMELGVQ